MNKFTWQIFLSVITSAAVQSIPINTDAEATILNYDYQLRQDGYSFIYSTSNGIMRNERASLIRDSTNQNSEDFVLRVSGSYTYTGEGNRIYRVNYVSDENGYRIEKIPKFGTKAEKISEEAQGISSAALASLSGN